MKILVTGAKGFVGRNLCAALEEIRNGHDKRQDHELPVGVEAIFAYDVDNSPEELDAWCKECDFVAKVKEIEESENKGIEKGRAEGVEKGIKGIVAIYHKINGSELDVIESVISTYDMDENEARAMVKKYW